MNAFDALARVAAPLVALVVLLTLAAAAVGVPAVLVSPAAVATGVLSLALVAGLVLLGRAGAGPRTPYW